MYMNLFVEKKYAPYDEAITLHDFDIEKKF